MQKANIVYAIVLTALFLCALYNEKKHAGTGNTAPALVVNGWRILLAAGIVLAVAIRVWRFGAIPLGFNQDGAMAAVDAKALTDYGTDRFGMRYPVHFTAWKYGQMSVLSSYLMIPFFKIFGMNPVTARLPQLLLSLMGLFFLYLFVKETSGEKEAIIVFLFAAICPWHFVQSRWVLDCNALPHVFIAGLYFLKKGSDCDRVKKQTLFLAVSMVFFGLCMYCYGITIYTLPVFLLAACIYLCITGKVKLYQAGICLLVYLLIAGPFILTMVINFLGLSSIQTPLFTIPYFSESVRSSDILFFTKHPLSQFVKNMKSLADIVFLQVDGRPTVFGLTYRFASVLIPLGLFVVIRSVKKNTGYALLLIFFLTGIWSGLITCNVNINRINYMDYAITILIGLGIVYILWHLPKCLPVLVFVFGSSFVLLCGNYFGSYAKTMEHRYYASFMDALQYCRELDTEHYLITSELQGMEKEDLSEILTLFWHQIDAHYYQGVTNEQDGREVLPYSERYQYAAMKDIKPEDFENTVFVIRNSDQEFFDLGKYEVKDFGEILVLQE